MLPLIEPILLFASVAYLAFDICASSNDTGRGGTGLRPPKVNLRGISRSDPSKGLGLKRNLPIDNPGVRPGSGVGWAFFGHNRVWAVWKAGFAVRKNKICLMPLVFRGTREAAVRTSARTGGNAHSIARLDKSLNDGIGILWKNYK
jgi:hypothetical protein